MMDYPFRPAVTDHSFCPAVTLSCELLEVLAAADAAAYAAAAATAATASAADAWITQH